jgi:hypothetical protein
MRSRKGVFVLALAAFSFAKPYREGTRRTTPLLCSGVARVKDPRSGTVFRAEAPFIGIGGRSTMYS